MKNIKVNLVTRKNKLKKKKGVKGVHFFKVPYDVLYLAVSEILKV